MASLSEDKNPDFIKMNEAAIEILREEAHKVRPYTDDDPEPRYFHYIEDPDRSDATMAMEILKNHGLWTEEDDRVAFGPDTPRKGKTPPQSFIS